MVTISNFMKASFQFPVSSFTQGNLARNLKLET
jgi:hypothetical protein